MSPLDARAPEIFLLLEENARLRDEVVHLHQALNAAKRLEEDTCTISKRLRKIVMDYRVDLNNLSKEFIQKTQF
jgi:hypothetical protein